MVTRSRRTKRIPVDANQFHRLVSVGQEIGVYDNQAEARRDNLELVLETVLNEFEKEYINE